jgi:hypothetical protein
MPKDVPDAGNRHIAKCDRLESLVLNVLPRDDRRGDRAYRRAATADGARVRRSLAFLSLELRLDFLGVAVRTMRD